MLCFIFKETMSLLLIALLLIAISVITLCALALTPLDTWKSHYKKEYAPLTETAGRVDWSTTSHDIWNQDVQPKIRLAAAVYKARVDIINLFNVWDLRLFNDETPSYLPMAAQLGYLVHLICNATGHSLTRQGAIKIAAFFFFCDDFAEHPDMISEELNKLLPQESQQIVNRCFDQPELLLSVTHHLRTSGCFQLIEEIAEAYEQPCQSVECPRPTVNEDKID